MMFASVSAKRLFTFILIGLILVLILVGLGALQVQATGPLFTKRVWALITGDDNGQLLPPPSEKLAPDQIVAEISKIYALPSEEPTVAILTEAEIKANEGNKLYQKAKVGDSLLTFGVAKKQILYDINTKKILDVSDLVVASAAAEVKEVRIALKNGTSKVGLTTKVEPEVKKIIPQTEVVLKENASKKDYDKTMVVLLNEAFKKEAEEVAKKWKVVLSSLPAGEIKPENADILLILGKDRT